MRRASIVIILITVVLAATAFGKRLFPETSRLTIFYSGSLNGNLAGCSCWGYPIAGLDKKAFFLKERMGKTSSGKDTLLLDTGNLFEPGEDLLQADLLMKSSVELGYHLFAMGEQDFSNGADRLAEYTAAFPFRSHNVSLLSGPSEDGGILYPAEKAPLVFDLAGTSVEVVSLTDPAVFEPYPREFLRFLDREDPRQVLLRLWGTPGHQPRILLFHGDQIEARHLASTGEVDIVIFSPDEEPFFEELPSGRFLISAGLDGNSIGELTITISNGKIIGLTNRTHLFHYSSSPSDPVIAARAEEYIAILRKRIER